MSKASIYFTVEQVDGKHDVKAIKQTLGAIRGVLSVAVNANTDSIAVDFDTTGTEAHRLEKSVAELGFAITDVRLEDHRME